MARARFLTASLVLLALVALVFGRTAGHEFLNLDDNRYVTDNPGVRVGLSADGAQWALTNLDRGNWHPLTWLSHQLDWTLFGDRPAGHHLVNVAWHGANSLLLLLLLTALTGSFAPSLLVAALFAVHPLHVESVAWVAERKDVLSTFFWLAATLAWVRRLRRPDRHSAAPALGLFALALASKPMPVTFPVVLLVLDFWPLGRLGRPGGGDGSAAGLSAVLREKIPFFALSAAASALAFAAQRQAGAVAGLEEFPLPARLGNALLSYLRYAAKTLVPVDLAVFYPFHAPIAAAVLAALASLVLATIIAVGLRRAHPWLLAGWLWYLVTLLPVIGIVQVGDQGMADRYGYVPLTGLFVAAAWGIRRAAPRALRSALPVAACGTTLLLAGLSWRQAGFWRDSETLLEHAVEVTGGSATASNNLGAALLLKGKVAEAVPHLEAALRLRPDHANARFNLGSALGRQGRFADAARQIEEGLRHQPGNSGARRLLAEMRRLAGMQAGEGRSLPGPPGTR